jgi:DNA-binding NarL/FixJ family response regulator
MSQRSRLAFIDDHPLLREGLVQAVARDPEIQVVGEGASAADALTIVRDHQPDLILLDLDMPGNVIETITAILAISPMTRVAILTAADSEDSVLEALRHGACAYILKGISGRELVAILRSILAGNGYVPPILAAGLIGNLATPKPAPPAPSQPDIGNLTEREHQILSLVSQGLSNKEIGLQLHLAEKTVKYHMTTILEKLHVRSRVEAALLMDRLSGKAKERL